MLKSCFNAYVGSSLEYCSPGWMSSPECYLCLLDSIVRNAERLCDGEPCYLEYRRKVSSLYLLYKIYHRVANPRNEYLNHLATARNARASATLGELTLMFLRCLADQFSQSFLPAAILLWNIQPSGVFSDDTLSSFKSAMNLCLLRA